MIYIAHRRCTHYNPAPKVSNLMQNRAVLRGLRQLRLVQISIVLILSALFLLKNDTSSAFSAIVGGLICIIPGWYFAFQAFRYSGARAAKQIVLRFYWGEAVKYLLTIMLFALAFKFLPISAFACFVSYIAAQLALWSAPWVLQQKS